MKHFLPMLQSRIQLFQIHNKNWDCFFLSDSVGQDQTARSVQSDLDLHRLLKVIESRLAV